MQSATRDGMTDAEAVIRLKAEGFNELPRGTTRTPLRIIGEVLREPMLALLLAGGVIYLLLGDLKEALILLAFALFAVLITVVQETRTEQVLEALRDLTSPRALVIRGGVRKRIAGRDVVRGDLVVLAEGDRVPADAVVIESHDLLADEFLLTGESVPVRKMSAEGGAAAPVRRPGGDDLPFVYSGALIVRGNGLGEVIATGPRSEIGKIGQSLHALEPEPPRLQLEMQRLVRAFAVVAAAVCLLAVGLYVAFRGGWLNGLLSGIALGMSMLPEEFPVVLTIFMAMGAWRISRARVLTRRAAAIEVLGAATVLCTDKTGTLTENRMAIVELRNDEQQAWHENQGPPPTGLTDLVDVGALASPANSIDPVDRAFAALKDAQEHTPERTHSKGWTLERIYGLRQDLLAMSQAWRVSDDEANAMVAAKGAPEAIAELCRLPPERRAQIMAEVHAMAAEGLRVIAMAQARHSGKEWPETQRDFDFDFVGLAGLADPLRAGVSDAVRECHTAGIRVVMITGDYPETAKVIARQAGIEADDVITGEELERLSDDELALRVRTAAVFARIMPEQKLRIVMALKADGEIVAMTGDGVNDAPSIKAAHIGIAMGGRGTDVAREASAIVLLDDDFGSIVKAIRLGRRIYDNLRKASGFIFSVHVPIAGLALLPLLLGFPILLGPIHIAFLQMIIDPVCSLAFEAERAEDDVMQRPPRSATESILSRGMITMALLQGAIALLLVAAIFIFESRQGMPTDEVRALSFFALIPTIFVLVLVHRTFSSSLTALFRHPNPSLMLILTGVLGVLSLTLFWPAVRELFGFGPLHLHDLTIVLACGIAALLLSELVKLIWRQRQPLA